MAILDIHTHPDASVLCDCSQHTIKRWAIRKGSEILPQILEAKKAGNECLLAELTAQLEKYNRTAQEIE